jgi:hypothetical protein
MVRPSLQGRLGGANLLGPGIPLPCAATLFRPLAAPGARAKRGAARNGSELLVLDATPASSDPRAPGGRLFSRSLGVSRRVGQA